MECVPIPLQGDCAAEGSYVCIAPQQLANWPISGVSGQGAFGYCHVNHSVSSGWECCRHRQNTKPPGLEVLYEKHDFRRYQSGQPTVFSGTYIIRFITVLQYVYTWLVLWFYGRSGPTGTFGNLVPPTKPRAQEAATACSAPSWQALPAATNAEVSSSSTISRTISCKTELRHGAHARTQCLPPTRPTHPPRRDDADQSGVQRTSCFLSPTTRMWSWGRCM